MDAGGDLGDAADAGDPGARRAAHHLCAVADVGAAAVDGACVRSTTHYSSATLRRTHHLSRSFTASPSGAVPVNDHIRRGPHLWTMAPVMALPARRVDRRERTGRPASMSR